jgi:hypothetical protein
MLGDRFSDFASGLDRRRRGRVGYPRVAGSDKADRRTDGERNSK